MKTMTCIIKIWHCVNKIISREKMLDHYCKYYHFFKYMHFSSLNEVTNLFFIILLWLSFLEINLFYNLRMPSFDNKMKQKLFNFKYTIISWKFIINYYKNYIFLEKKLKNPFQFASGSCSLQCLFFVFVFNYFVASTHYSFEI